MNRRTSYKLKQLGIIIVIWLIIGFFIPLYDRLALFTTNAVTPLPKYTIAEAVAINMGAAFIGALLGGSLLVFYVNVKFRDRSYGYTIVTVILSFLVVVTIVNIVLRLFAVPSDPLRILKNCMIWGVVVGITQLFLQINNKFGQGVFWNILRGKYNTPKEESRIFMFLDLNSSTTIAEKLGAKKYHAFLKDIFTDITNPILDNKGEIYQYVGDEVIVAWKYNDGIQNSKCVQCFFDIKYHLQQLNNKYIRQYGLAPSFKAGIHCGKVVAGEVGIIKRDITYSGDVLNTTSRIQDMCKEFNEEVIVSGDLAACLRLADNFAAQTLGSIKLKGKQQEMLLIALKWIGVE
ncbi:adenylate/guanylate cyclase domain-containing protein [Chitinophaga sp. S165]|uniref:adenylate/guanylate cyclase domain-containing protein n=1 Tax=Chitinophaga sp. S165 TaxID=2135462 RepID=UPI000D715F6A|nr:adenylate/guanylate cyclase domain-containing protein [Chitinophaga sp. S165]PWV51924.1 adenylate cyclase [Chitinophaga sp. S165]